MRNRALKNNGQLRMELPVSVWPFSLLLSFSVKKESSARTHGRHCSAVCFKALVLS
jgi:hypothetical protein